MLVILTNDTLVNLRSGIIEEVTLNKLLLVSLSIIFYFSACRLNNGCFFGLLQLYLHLGICRLCTLGPLPELLDLLSFGLFPLSCDPQLLLVLLLQRIPLPLDLLLCLLYLSLHLGLLPLQPCEHLLPLLLRLLPDLFQLLL